MKTSYLLVGDYLPLYMLASQFLLLLFRGRLLFFFKKNYLQISLRQVLWKQSEVTDTIGGSMLRPQEVPSSRLCMEIED